MLDHFGKVPCSTITRLKADEFLMAVVKERTPVAGNNGLKMLRETMARSMEVHRLIWNRVNFGERYVELETRKNREPVLRRVPMTDKRQEVLSDLYADRDPGKEWVFWTRSHNAKTACRPQSARR